MDGTEAMCTVVCQGCMRSGFARVQWHRGCMSGNTGRAQRDAKV